MHATYLFLAEFEGDDSELSSFCQSAVATYVEDFGDENNWYQEMAVVRRDGTFVKLCEDGDWRGREWLGNHLAEMPQEERWDHMVTKAYRCIAYDMELFNASPISFGGETTPIDTATPEQIHNEIIDNVPRRIAEIMSSRIGVEPTQRFDLDLYRARKVLRIYESYCDSEHKPWMYCTSTYDNVRAMYFDVANWDSPNLVIIAVDIHT